MALYVEDGYVASGYTQTGVTVIWGNREVFVPKIAMVQIQSVPTEIWQLDIPAFKETLADLLDDTDGMSYPDIFNHNPSVTVGGAVLAKVVEIINDYTITFEDGQYAVNLTGANSNIGDRVNVNQVSVRSANSAGLQDLTSLQAASFGGGVSVDQVNGTNGTIFPLGTKGKPVKTFADAILVAQKQNIDNIFVIGSATLDTGDNVDGYILVGQNPTKTLINILDGASTIGTEIKLCTLTGILDGGTVIRECLVYDINYVNGFLVDCVLGVGTVTLGGGATALFMRCVSGVPGSLTPVIDMGGSGQSLGMRDYNGGIKIINKTGDDPFSLDIASGQVILDSTVTNGTMVCRGVGKLKDYSTGTSLVINEMLNGAEVSNAQRLIELTRSSHSAMGKVWYWDPYTGDDTFDGDHVSRGIKTFSVIHDLIVSGRGDTVIALSTNPNGHTVTTENIVISKDDIFLRGQGESFEIKSADDNLDGVNITGHGCEVSSMTLSTSPTNTRHCVYIQNSNTLIKDITLTDAVDGIDIAAGEYNVIKNVKAHHNGGYGIKVGGTAQHTDIMDCHIGGNGGDGIILDATVPHEVVIGGDTIIHKNTGYGINISASMTNVTIGKDVSVFSNTAGDILDNGVGTEIITASADIVSVTGSVVASIDDFKADLSGIDLSAVPAAVWAYATRELTQAEFDANIIKVNNTAVTSIDEFKADVSNLSADVNVIEVNGVAVTSIDDFKATVVTVPQIVSGLLNTDINTYTLTHSIGQMFKRSEYIESRVYVDTDSLINGDGGQHDPFNNINDAKDFMEISGDKIMVLSGSAIVPNNFKNITVIGIGVPTINLNAQDMKNSKFYQCSLSGTYTDSIIAQDCVLQDGLLLNGFFEKCALGGDLSIEGASTLIANCFSGIAGSGRPTLDMNSGSPSSVSVRNYSGGLTILNSDHVDDAITVEMNQGSLTFDATCTAGTMVARGVGRFVDNSSGATVIDEVIDDNANIVSVMGTGVTSIVDFRTDLTSIPAAVWTYGTRELTATLGLTAEQEAKLDAIPTALQNATAVWEFDIPDFNDPDLYLPLFPQGRE